MQPEFKPFKKVPRLYGRVTITEKIDGTNGLIYINGDTIYAGSRSRWLNETSQGDNFGFCKWVMANADELMKLGNGYHYGEWFGWKIGRGYGLDNRRFALFNTGRWLNNPDLPSCCEVVPILFDGEYYDGLFQEVLLAQKEHGSAIKGADDTIPEGFMVHWHRADQVMKVPTTK